MSGDFRRVVRALRLQAEREAANKQLRVLVKQLLEHAEKPLGAEEWFALRDHARATLADVKGGAR